MAIDLMCPYCGRTIRANPYRGKANFRAHIEACPKNPGKTKPQEQIDKPMPPPPPVVAPDAEDVAWAARRRAAIREDRERMRVAIKECPWREFTPPF